MRQGRTLFEDGGRWLLAMVLIGALAPNGVSGAEDGPLDDAWHTLRDNPRDYEASQRLLYAFDQARDAFDQRLRGEDERERRLARQLLRDSIERLRPGWSVGDDERAAAARAQLIEAATVWARDPSPFVGATGRLLWIGHGAADLEATIMAAIGDAQRDPEGWPWLAWALGHVIRDQHAFDRLPTTATDLLLAQAVRAPVAGLGRAEGSARPSGDVFAWLFHFGGARAVAALDDAATAGRAPPGVRLELLRRVTERPWDLAPDRIVRLLDQPWLHAPQLEQDAQRLFIRLHEVLAGVPAARDALRDPLRLFVLRATQCGLCWLDERQPLHYEPSVLALLTTDDLRPMIQGPQDVARWLWLLALTGAWADITPDLEALLEAPATSVPAARALAPLGHPRALDVLITQLLEGFELPAGILAPYGTSALRALEARATEARPEARELVDLARVRLGGTAQTADALWREAETSFEVGALPTGLVALLLHGSGYPVFERLVTSLGAAPESDRIAARWIYDLGPDFAQTFTAWVKEDAQRERQAAPVLRILDTPFWPEVRAWGEQVVEAMTPRNVEIPGG